MWGRKRQAAEEAKPEQLRPQRLKDALRKARVDSAERSGIVVDLHDAEVARLELLNEAIEPLFSEIPAEVDLFDLGISRGETPKLWIDAIAHVAMGRDKRVYRFVQDTRYGRKVLAESMHIPEIVHAVTKYLALRLVERSVRSPASARRRSRICAVKPIRAPKPTPARHRDFPARPLGGRCGFDRRRPAAWSLTIRTRCPRRNGPDRCGRSGPLVCSSAVGRGGKINPRALRDQFAPLLILTHELE